MKKSENDSSSNGKGTSDRNIVSDDESNGGMPDNV